MNAPTPQRVPMHPALKILIALGVLFGLGIPCCGITSAIAIPAFVGYVRRSKTAEARANVAAIALGVESYCTSESAAGAQGFPPAAGPTRAFPDAAREVFMGGSEWASVGFTPVEPLYYSYSMGPDGPGVFVVLAEGDLDGDGARSRFESRCTLDVAGCACGPVIATDELE